MAVKKMTQTAFMLALIIVLSIFESSLPPIAASIPGIRMGLSNIVTMYALFTVGKRSAVMLNILKSFSVFVTRGAIAASLSLTGGMLSILVIIFLHAVLKDNIGYAALSVSGAVFHNVGQLAAISVILNNPAAIGYLPVLIVSGVIMGLITGTILNTVMPSLLKQERNL